jgi:ABC-2 type transport system permease protein
MFAKIAAFEFRYQLRQPAFWVIGILFFLLAFGLVASENVSLGAGGNVHKNAPFALVQAHIVWAIFFMLATTAIVANVVARDATTGFGSIVQTTRISRFDYLYGRFAGAFAVVALCFLSVSLGMLVGSVMPWVDPETLGPIRIGDYLYAYFVFGLPGIFLTSALFFTLATVTRSMMATYVGVVGFFIVYLTATAALDRPEFATAMAWLEPFGASAYELVSRYWTAAERNSLNAPLEGVLLFNRLIWVGVGLVFLALAYWLYRPATRGAKLKKQEKLKAISEVEAAMGRRLRPLSRAGSLPSPRHGFLTGVRQMFARIGFEMGLVFKSPAYLVLIVLGIAFAVANLLFAGEMYGAPVMLVTRVVIQILTGAFGLIAMIVAIYYAGEIVWRDRDRRTHEIIDATAAPDWSFLIPKTLALALVLVSTLVVAMLAGIAVQAVRGVTDFEIGKYLAWYIWPQAISYGLLAVLAIFVQSLSPNKFVGWAVMVVYLIATIVLINLGFEHILYRYGRTLAVPLSDMNGQGDFGAAAAWVNAYWTALAVVLLVITYGLWRRGTETRLKPRLKRLPRQLMGPTGLIGGVALVVFVGLGAFIYVNTNIWNEYRTSDDNERFMAAYEKALLPFETVPQPAVADVVLALDLDPHAPRLATRGTYVLENRTNAPLPVVHLRWDRDLEVTQLDVEGATLERGFDAFNYRIFRFATPMAPGERRTVNFQTVLQQRGFRNSGDTTRLVDNGTFVSNGEFALQVGMGRMGLMQDRTVRRKHGLPAELRPARLEDTTAQAHNYIGADWVNADITVTTVANQTPIAPGYKVSDITRDGRRTARFVTEAPILHFFSVQSADYQVTREDYRGVELAIYHHPGHGRNVERMIAALKAGLDYFQPAFGDYQFRQARIIEFPAYASFAQAFANTMPYSEGIGFIADFRNPEKIDYVTYITAHELAHQWWAHQVIGADMQGGTALSETLAQYSALMVMEQMYGPDQIRRFLKFELDSYLRGRSGELVEELPLMRVENQPYIHYRKGSLVMYLLKDMIGEDAVNRALRRLVDQYAFRSAPYPRSIDLVSALRAEAGPEHQDLITDLFERITLYDIKTTGATATRRPDGRYDVTVTIEARKLYADGQGVETEAPLNEAFDIGLFTAEPGKRDFNQSSVLLFERRQIRSGRQTLTFITDRAPTFAGADPYNKRIDRNADDNVVRVGR